MSKESSLWQWLSKAKEYFGADLHMTRVENAVDTGTPDVEGSLEDGQGFWIELKSTDRPKRNNTPIDFGIRDSQIRWIERRVRAGGNVWLLLQVGSAQYAKRYLVHGKHVTQVHEGMVEGALALIADDVATAHEVVIQAAKLPAGG